MHTRCEVDHTLTHNTVLSVYSQSCGLHHKNDEILKMSRERSIQSCRYTLWAVHDRDRALDQLIRSTQYVPVHNDTVDMWTF